MFKINVKNIILTILLAVVCVNLSSCGKKQEAVLDNTHNEINQKVASIDVTPEEFDELVIVDVEKVGRANPFQKYKEKLLTVDKSLVMNKLPMIDGISVDKINTPPNYEEKPEIETLLSIKIAGILYDKVRPSAIVNISNTDYLVHKGDMLFDFYIKDISLNKVTVKYEENSYKAGVGEIIDGKVNNNLVYKIENKFAGSVRVKAIPD